MPLFSGGTFDQPFREATVHHSEKGAFAIRQGKWKLAMTAGSGGWSYPTPEDVKRIDSLPPVQLFDLENDPGEKKNLQADYPGKVKELKELLTQYVTDGRSTPGSRQANEGKEIWEQLWWMKP